MKPIDIHNFEQSAEFIVSTIPTFLFSFYDNSLKAGFSEEQAFLLTIQQFAMLNGNANEQGRSNPNTN